MESDIPRIIMYVKILLGVLGVSSIGAAVAAVHDIKKKKELCTEKVKAHIVDEVKVYSTGFMSDPCPEYTWYFVYEYVINGMTIKAKSNAGHAKERKRTGQSDYVYVNPKNPKQLYCPTEREEIIPKIFIGVGFLLLLICAIFVLLEL